MGRIRAEKDFYAGVLYALLAIAFLWFGREYKMGAASRMGPGYFPLTLGWIMLGFGVVSMVRSFFVDGAPVGGVAWKKLAIITLAIVVFAALLPGAGLVFALPALIAISALASQQSEYDLKALLALIGLTIFCVVIFVKGLGVPMPIFGSWFDGLVPHAWQR